jgi:hypothetical protein
VKAFRPIWTAFRTAVLATAVFAVVLFVVTHSGWKGLSFAGMDMTIYAVFFGVFFLGLLMSPKA